MNGPLLAAALPGIVALGWAGVFVLGFALEPVFAEAVGEVAGARPPGTTTPEGSVGSSPVARRRARPG
jgi:hypothetical protein